jgi:hypothetical protein
MTPSDGQKGAAGLFLAVAGARSTSKPSPGLKKRLHTDAARWLLPGHRPERSAWLGRYIRDLLTAARCAELPPAARDAGQHWPWRRSFRARAHHWLAVTTPRCTTQPADAVVASHRAADGAGPSIEGARTHAGGISRGAVVRFPVFRSTIWLHRRRALRDQLASGRIRRWSKAAWPKAPQDQVAKISGWI